MHLNNLSVIGFALMRKYLCDRDEYRLGYVCGILLPLKEGKRVKSVKYLLMLVLLVASQIAAAVEPVFGTAAESQYSREITPPAGKVIVYIYQTPADDAGVSPTIWLNNYKIGRLVPGSFTVWKISPGQLEVRVDGVDPTSLSLVSQAGKTYLFRLSFVQSALGPKVQLEGLPGSYRPDLAAIQLIKNPREVTTIAQQVHAQPAPVANAPAKTSAPAEKAVTDYPSETSMVPQPGGVSLMLKTGSLSMSTQNQTILGTERTFSDSASGVFAIEVDYQFDSGLIVGGELLSYKTEFTSVGLTNTHNVDARILLATTKQYFRTDANLQPYIGAGVGVATTDVSGPSLAGSTFGIAYQLMAGVEYRFSNIGIFAEYKYLVANTEDSNNEKVDVSSAGILAGLAIHF